jgi:NAD(P)-dependent dehydrogenase (short-subunit alcohol dehydrogenase family)
LTLPSPFKSVLVTGAAKRLGRAIALDLAAHGWAVAVHYRGSAVEAAQTVSDLRALGATAVAVQADLAVELEARALLPQAARALAEVGMPPAALRAVVNSASLFDFDDAASFSYGRMDAHLHANTAAPVVLAQALASHVRAQAGAQGQEPAPGAACVVNLLDQKLWNPNPDFLSYTLSKAALRAATTLLAQALAPAVRVVGVAPGLTLTSHMLSDEAFAALHRLSPLGRSSTPEDVAAAVRFALENQSVTGTELLVDGGQHLMPMARDFSLMPQPAPAASADAAPHAPGMSPAP